jgi:hypothetical protein
MATLPTLALNYRPLGYLGITWRGRTLTHWPPVPVAAGAVLAVGQGASAGRAFSTPPRPEKGLQNLWNILRKDNNGGHQIDRGEYLSKRTGRPGRP